MIFKKIEHNSHINPRKRIIKQFLFFPKLINGKIKWLTYIKYEQRFIDTFRIDPFEGVIFLKYWEDFRWVDE